MAYLISAYFDEKSNKNIQHLIDKVARETGNTFMLDNNVPPHMTIASIEARSPEVLIPRFTVAARQMVSGSIRFVTVGQLLPYVMYIAPVYNAYIDFLMDCIEGNFKGLKDVSMSKYYRKKSMIPHVTIGKTLNHEQMQTAFKVLQDNFQPFEATIVEVGLAKTNPHEDITRIRFQTRH